LYGRESRNSFDPKGMPWTLSQVSQQRRSVAFSYSGLWSTIRIYASAFRPGVTRSVQSHMSFMLALQLYRSGNRLLSVEISTNHDPFSVPSAHYKLSSINPLLPVLFATSARWNELWLEIRLDSLQALKRWATSFPQMTTLHLNDDDTYS